MEEQLKERQVEPVSGQGKAMRYMILESSVQKTEIVQADLIFAFRTRHLVQNRLEMTRLTAFMQICWKDTSVLVGEQD